MFNPTLTLTLTLTLFPLLPAQQFTSDEEIEKFADHLFCEGDFLRSIIEYRSLSDFNFSLNYQRKVGIAFMKMEKYDSALAQLESNIFNEADNLVRDEINLLKLKIFFLKNDFYNVDNFVPKIENESISQSIQKLKFFSKLIKIEETTPQPLFADEEKSSVNKLLEYKNNINIKSPTTAALLSIIPGLGKVYTEEYGDAISAFIFNSVFAFLAYDNFSAGHNIRGWIFSAVSAGYYGGNIYGAAASAQIYNARTKAQFKNEVETFLINKNYFVPPSVEYECKD